MDPLPGDSVEQQIDDKFGDAFLFVFGDEPVPEQPTIVDPLQAQAFAQAQMQAVRESLTLLAREIDGLKAGK
jgi:hypothetical protein